MLAAQLSIWRTAEMAVFARALSVKQERWPRASLPQLRPSSFLNVLQVLIGPARRAAVRSSSP
eukprot:8860618-Lingulodinium_polyedra.AAC.1